MKEVKEKLVQFVSNPKAIVALFTLLALAAGIQSLLGTKTYEDGGITYNGYNNYTIFVNSFHHLVNNQDLYILYPQEHWDLFKYTPSFAVFFGFFGFFPDWFGVNLWNLLNSLLLVAAVYLLPGLDNLRKGLILLIVLVETMTSMQNGQSNALIAGLILLSFGLLERDEPFLATLFIIASAFIKLFGIVALALLLLYPKKTKSALYVLFWTVVFALLPLIFVDNEQYLKMIASYFRMLSEDYDASMGYSVMGWLKAWFSIDIDKNMVVASGALAFMLPFAKIKSYKDLDFRMLILSSALIWMVIFNHKAESPTFVIAMTGLAIWFVQSPKNTFNILLFAVAFVFVSLSPTDIFPRQLREAFVKPYVMKAFPCILVWGFILYTQLTYKPDEKSAIV
ncbi:glycosyltransferase family 87 protein [Bacteroidales bacterium]